MATIGYQPHLMDATALIALTAAVIGHVVPGPEASIWFGAVLRGDAERIENGGGTNIGAGAGGQRTPADTDPRPLAPDPSSPQP